MAADHKLYRPLFLISVLLLLLNDLYFKYAFSNFLTGKLSDFAGLFAFPYFLAYVLKKRITFIYIATGIIFIIWKSEFIQPIIDNVNFWSIGLHRTIDYTDLAALSILPFSYYYWRLDFKLRIKPLKFIKPVILGICCFSFIATSLESKTESYNWKSNYKFTVKTPYENAQNELGFYQSKDTNSILYTIELPERNASINTKINISKTHEGLTEIMLDSILQFHLENMGSLFRNRYDENDLKYLKNISQQEIEQLLEVEIKKKFLKK